MTYSSLIYARLTMMPSDVAKFMLSVWSVSGNRDRLRDEMRKRSLAVLDRNGVDTRAKWLVLAVLGDLGRGTGSKTSRRSDVVSNDQVV